MSKQDAVSKMLRLDSFLPYRLSVLSNKISRSISEYYEKKYDLSRAEWRTIAVLGETQDLSAAEVAERTAMDKVAISRAVKNLLKHKRIKRYFAAADKRRSVLTLSHIGQQIYKEITPIALAHESRLLAGLDKDERDCLDSILNKLNQLQEQSSNIQ